MGGPQGPLFDFAARFVWDFGPRRGKFRIPKQPGTLTSALFLIFAVWPCRAIWRTDGFPGASPAARERLQPIVMMRIEQYQHILHPLLAPLGAAYAGGMRIRRRLYETRVLRSWRARVPTVSVGNIGWGGTGKTPLTDWLLDWAAQRNLDAVVLTRGYRARPRSLPHLVQPGHLAEEAGDEPLMLCRRHPEARIVVDPVRARGGRWAERNARPGVVFLDDGFQHLAVRRDLDLVLLRPSDLGSGWGRVIPAGSWREGSSALQRAGAFLIKTSAAGFRRMVPLFERRLLSFGVPVFSFELVVQGLVHVLTGQRRPHPLQQPYMLVTGVGEPAQVERTATRFMGHAPKEHIIYPDHHPFSRLDVKAIEQRAAKLHCPHVVCTPKDAVKLGPLSRDNFWTFDLDVRFGPAWRGHGLEGARFDAWWDARFDKIRAGLANGASAAERKKNGTGNPVENESTPPCEAKENE